MTFQVDILNPKAGKLLKELADKQFISITEIPPSDPFMTIVKRLRKKAAQNSPTLEEITKEVIVVRYKRYAKKEG